MRIDTQQFTMPITREELTLALLESLGSPVLASNAHTYLDQILALPPHPDPLIREMRLVRFAAALIGYGTEIASSSPLYEEFKKILEPLITSVTDQNSEGVQHYASLMQMTISLLEASITGEECRCADSKATQHPEFQSRMAEAKNRLTQCKLGQD